MMPEVLTKRERDKKMIGIGIDTGGTYTDAVVYDMEKKEGSKEAHYTSSARTHQRSDG